MNIKKFGIVVLLMMLVVSTTLFYLKYYSTKDTTANPTLINAPAMISNPNKLFSTQIGTNIDEGGPKLGVFVDERTIQNYDKFYFPASFAVDKDLNTVFVLDSIRNRFAIFSLGGTYKGEIKIPFNLHAIDFTWFPKTQTLVMIFQDKPYRFGVLKVNPTNNFVVVSSDIYDISKVLGIKEIKDIVMNIWPVNIQDSTKNSFTLSMDSNDISDPVFVQSASGTSRVLNLNKSLKGIIGLQDKMAVVGYGDKPGSEILIQDLVTNKITALNLASSSLDLIVADQPLVQLQFVGTDKNSNVYLAATYAGKTIESATKLFIYKLNSTNGAVIGKQEVFFSPKMLTNRYIFVDQNGSVYYMHANEQKYIVFYEYKI